MPRGEGNAIADRADHLVVMDVAERRGVLGCVVGCAIGFDAAALIRVLSGLVWVGTLDEAVMDFEWLVGGSARSIEVDDIANQAVGGVVNHLVPAQVDSGDGLHVL